MYDTPAVCTMPFIGRTSGICGGGFEIISEDRYRELSIIYGLIYERTHP